MCKGFVYEANHSTRFDLYCSSITEPFTHGCHPHPLLYIKVDHDEIIKTCQGCGICAKEMVLGCTKCKFYVDFRCATLPLTVRLGRYDDHPLTLCYGEKASGKYWCDICEGETDPETWFYTCMDCGVTLHVLCVFGDLRYAKAGEQIDDGIVLASNSRSSRPVCNNCHCHCPGPLTLKNCNQNVYFCSLYCVVSSKYSWRWNMTHLSVPPWLNQPST
ncbi:unnamed protein product [Microthlaspi erraticum]|uniref:Uncharacterized protein n=1 Tax=Microthlaspi erraticum TaxID=1685480 RepID=A0A6D2JXL5_9BRAS|nr:unnamed protein product [Microthlaspi erraticum]